MLLLHAQSQQALHARLQGRVEIGAALGDQWLETGFRIDRLFESEVVLRFIAVPEGHQGNPVALLEVPDQLQGGHLGQGKLLSHHAGGDVQQDEDAHVRQVFEGAGGQLDRQDLFQHRIVAAGAEEEPLA
jgi:hypothetical protein